MQKRQTKTPDSYTLSLWCANQDGTSSRILGRSHSRDTLFGFMLEDLMTKGDNLVLAHVSENGDVLECYYEPKDIRKDEIRLCYTIAAADTLYGRMGGVAA